MNNLDNIFIYKSFSWKLKSRSLHTKFIYQSRGHTFSHQILFRFPADINTHLKLDSLVFHLGLSEMPSYWKAFCSPVIQIDCGHLTSTQIKFWHKLFLKGMGEYFYQNQIDFTPKNFLTITSHSSKIYPPTSTQLSNSYLVPIGGGKDSCVTLDLIQHLKKTLTAIKVETTTSLPAIDAVLKRANVSQYIHVKRTLDPKILSPQKHHFLQGHIPFSATLAFISSVASIIQNHRYIVLSNESSANQGNIEYLGTHINHQYSKSFEFERDFHLYAKKYLHPQIYYFSILRPLNELQISQAFSKLPHFFPVFKSCNKNQDSWCGHCAKCLSTYLMLKPFLENISFISSKNLVQDKENRNLLRALLGVTKQKPFECVATFEETQAALDFINHNKKSATAIIKLLTSHHSSHLIPKHLLISVNLLLKPKTLPLIPISKILILGYGREGQSTLLYLLKNFPQLDITVADQSPQTEANIRVGFPDSSLTILCGDTYPKTLDKFQLIFKSPGISHRNPIFQTLDNTQNILTSQTKLFFEICRGTIIGVTGTKGKSTTTSLIHHVLVQNHLPAKLLGNIGHPALDYLEQNEPKTIYCFELSSHQLFDLYQSPKIAVLQGIFPEHLDYYHNFSEYAQAKLNIVRFQHYSDHLIFNSSQNWPNKAAKISLANLHPFTKSKPEFLESNNSPLKGRFNYQNIWPSVIIGQIFNLSVPQIAKTIKSFQPLSHRLETVAIKKGIEFIDDSLSTTPIATIAAVKTFPNKLGTLILGGANRNQNFNELIKPLQRANIKNIILLPPTGKKIENVVQPHLPSTKFFHATSMKKVIEIALRNTPPDHICLLSTAAPSFGMFKDYEDKAAQFKYWIEKLT